MIQNQPAEFIRKPRTLVYAKRVPDQSLDALKLDALFLAYAQAGHLSCSKAQITNLLPNLNDTKILNIVLAELNALVFSFRNIQIKPYEYVRHSQTDDAFIWEYTRQYIDYYLSALIPLPDPHGDPDSPFCPPEVIV